MCNDWSLGVSIGRSVHQYRTNGLSVWMTTKRIVLFCFPMALDIQLQLNKNG